jgi:hypothetical protein
MLDKKFSEEYKGYMAGRKKKGATKTIYVRVSKTLNQRLREDAERQGRELSGHIRIILENHYATAN